MKLLSNLEWISYAKNVLSWEIVAECQVIGCHMSAESTWSEFDSVGPHIGAHL